MKILGVDCNVPSQKICNNEILELISYYSRPTYNADIEELIARIKFLLDKTGIESRYWRNRNEKPLEMIEESFSNLISRENILRKDIDTIIYVGVDRGFIEPANSCFVAKKLGLYNARTFDIVDACMGWCTALHTSQALINNNNANNILIVSSECPNDKGGVIFPRNYTIENIDELDWKFPSFTIGEAVTTTIVSRSKNNWKFYFRSNSKYADLCTIPLYKWNEYSENTSKLKDKDQLVFSAYGKDLFTRGYKDALYVLKELLNNNNPPQQIILPHSVSMQVPSKAKENIDSSIEFYSTFPKLGNVATSSIPAHIYYGMMSNKIKKGDRVAGWIASGGLKYAAFDIFI